MPLDTEQLPFLTHADLQDGDILVELADLQSAYGRVAYRFGWLDAERKGVPVCQHALMIASRNGKKTQIEAIWRVTESPLKASGKRYIVVRATAATPEQTAAAIAWARSKVGEIYGFENLFKLGLRLAWPWFTVKADEKDPLVCSQVVTESWEEGARYKEWGERDAQLTPWDLLTPLMQPEFAIVGRLCR